MTDEDRQRILRDAEKVLLDPDATVEEVEAKLAEVAAHGDESLTWTATQTAEWRLKAADMPQDGPSGEPEGIDDEDDSA